MAEPLQVIRANGGAEAGSFVGRAHHGGVFDPDALNALCDALDALGAGPPEVRASVDPRTLHRIHAEILACLVRHLAGQDPLAGFPDPDDLEEHMERLEWCVHTAWTGERLPRA